MSDWETLLNKVKIGSSPNTYLTVKYRYQRVGADMLYDVYVKGELQYSSSYRNDSQGLDIRLDDGTTTSGTYTDRYYNSKWKPSGSGHWPVSQTFSFRLHNKTTGKLKLYVRFWDSQGSASIDYSNTWYDLYVSPAGPILQKGSISQYINHLKVNISNTITGNMSKYELAKVSGGTVIKSGNLSAVTSFTIDITGLNPNVSYSGVYKIRAYANDCWGNWLTLNDSNLKTKSLPTASLGSTNPVLETDKQSININSNDDISSFQYELKTNDGTSIKSESSLSGTSKNISLSSANINTILQKYPNTQNAGCKIITKVISNGVTYTLNELSFDYLIPNTYKPTFDSTNIIEVTNVGYADIMGTHTSKYIKGHNRLQGKIVPMVVNGYSSGVNYLISCGNKQVSLNYSENNQVFTLDNIDGNTLNVIAIDSRGFINSGSKTLVLVDYSNPICDDINIVRQGGVGTVAVLNAKGKYTNWSGLALDNKIISVKYKYRTGDENYSNLIDITNSLTVNADGTWEIKDALLDTTFDASNKYDIVIVFSDRLETITLNPYKLSTADVLLWKDLANKRLGVNKKPDYSLDVDGDVSASGSLRVDGNINANNYLGQWTDINTGFTKGIPTGGTAGQLLAKKTNIDYDVEWKTLGADEAPMGSITASTASGNTNLGSFTAWGWQRVPLTRVIRQVNSSFALEDNFLVNKSNKTINVLVSANGMFEYSSSSNPTTYDLAIDYRTANATSGNAVGEAYFKLPNAFNSVVVSPVLVSVEPGAKLSLSIRFNNDGTAKVNSDGTFITIQELEVPVFFGNDSAIVESGSNANGDYIKYSDGHMECYKTIIVTGINITNKWGSLYENGSDILLGNFAQTFKERPTVSLTKSDGHGCFIQVHDKISTTSAGRCYVASATSRSNASLTFEIIAKGKWK